MKLKNGEIWLAKEPLQEVGKMPAEKLSWKGKYWLAKLGRVLSGPHSDVESARVKLVQEHGDKTDTGYTIPAGERLVKFQEQFAEILRLEIEIDWKPVMLTDKDAEALTVEQMMALDLFIIFPDPGETPNPSANGAVKDAEAVVKK